MTAWDVLAASWPWEPSVVLGCVVLLAGYLVAVRMRPPRESVWFVAGVAVLWLALDSPLDTLADAYLFSAHMLQHLLLLLVVPPLLLLGTPRAPLAGVWRSPHLERAGRALARPAVAWGVGIGAMWIWHLPVLYNRALQDGGVHVLQHLSFLVTSAIFWWPVLTPLPSIGVAPLAGILYLLAAALATSVLGIILTFAPIGAYPAYLHPADTLGILPFIRNGWGFSPEIDQQVGGFLMWIPGGLVYLCAIVAVLARWYRTSEAGEAI